MMYLRGVAALSCRNRICACSVISTNWILGAVLALLLAYGVTDTMNKNENRRSTIRRKRGLKSWDGKQENVTLGIARVALLISPSILYQRGIAGVKVRSVPISRAVRAALQEAQLDKKPYPETLQMGSTRDPPASACLHILADFGPSSARK